MNGTEYQLRREIASLQSKISKLGHVVELLVDKLEDARISVGGLSVTAVGPAAMQEVRSAFGDYAYGGDDDDE